MSYDHLVDELNNLNVRRIARAVRHIGRKPPSASDLRRGGLSNIAAHFAPADSRKPLADRMADDPFKWGKNCRPGRYSKGFPALYTACDLESAIAEVRYHLLKNGALEDGSRATYRILEAIIDGAFKDLAGFSGASQRELVFDSDYRPPQRVGSAAHAEPLDYLAAPSARRSGSTNFPVFVRTAVRPSKARTVIEFYLDRRGKFAWSLRKPS